MQTKSMLRSLLLLIIIITCFAARGQKIIISGKEGDRPLVWSDFTGVIDNSSSFDAFTKWNMRYQFSNVKLNSDSIRLKNFEAILELDPQKSWSKQDRQTEALLVHEQGHFNIGKLCLNEVVNQLRTTAFAAINFPGGIKDLLNATINKYVKMEVQYDEETNHSKNKPAQEKWNEFFKSSLEKGSY